MGERIFEYSFLKTKYFKTNKEGDYILVRQNDKKEEKWERSRGGRVI